MKINFLLKIIILNFILFFVINNNSIYADNIEGKNWSNPSDTWSGQVGLIPKNLNEKRVSSMAVYITGGNGLSIDSASITIDTNGLAGYKQVQQILDYVYYDSQTFTYINNADNSDSIISIIKTQKVKKLYTEIPSATFDWYGITDGITDKRKNQIKSITY